MPVYNAEAFVRTTIASVQAQTYPHWELLVVDDCSTDGSRQIVSEMAAQDARIRLIALERNYGGPAGPRNVGARLALAKWVALLDADDIWHPSKLEYQMRHLNEREERFCSTQMRDFTRDEEVNFQVPGNVAVEKITFSQQLKKIRTPHSSVVVDRELLLEFPFNEDPRYRAREDMDCWLRIHERIGHSIKLKFPFMYYRRSTGQISGSKLRMLKRNFFVLDQFRLGSGRSLGWRKYYYISTYLVYAVYYRLLKKKL